MGSTDIDSLFSKWDKDDSPGCVLAVIQDGEIVYEKAYGLANLEHGVPLGSDSVFRIGSISKQFTAMCVALLERKGKLSFDDSIREYIPELPDYANAVTIRHMIHHISGIRSYTNLFALAMFTLDVSHADSITQSDTIEMIARQKAPNFKPGERYEYSNSNYFLLGLIVERVSGKSLRDFAEKHIFKPLGMKNTHFHDDSKMVVPNRAYGYAPKDEGGFEVCMSNCEVVGDGCVFTTVRDLLLWDSNFYNNRLPGGKKLIKTMETSGTLNSGEEHPYAFGLAKSDYKGLPLIDHGGGWAGFVCYMGRLPEQRFSVIVLANVNTIPVGNLGLQVADLFLDQYFSEEARTKQTKTEPEKSVILPDHVLEAIVGLYITSKGFLIDVTKEGTNLAFEMPGWKASRTIYVPVSETRFKPNAGVFTSIVEIEQTSKKKQPKLVFNRKDGSRSECEPIPKTIPMKEMKAYIGEYYSKELDTVYILEKSKDKSLFCRTPHSWSENIELFKLRKDELVLLENIVKFRRNKQDQVTGFDLQTPHGVSGMRFRKRK